MNVHFDCLKQNFRGLLSVFGAFLVQLTAGAYHGTFGNLLPYISSYVKEYDSWVTHGDLAMVFSTGGLAQGVSFMLGGLVFVPLLGKRGCLVFGSLLFISAPLLTYFTLNSGVIGITFSYGIIGGSAANMIMVPTLLIPVTWFPDHKGKVIGIVASGFGLSSFVFAPIQTMIINPGNISPVPELETNSSSSYFKSEEVLSNLPPALLYLGVIYSVLLAIGVILTVEKESSENNQRVQILDRLRNSFSYLFKETFTRKDFYLLFLTRFLFLAVGCGILAHWKTFSFTKSSNDKLISIVGGVNGIMNSLSRIVAGALLDKYQFNRVMPAFAAILTVILASIFFISQESVVGLVICVWTIYALSFSHFGTVPAQTIGLFRSVHNGVVVGTIGLADSFSYAFLGLVNKFIMSNEDDPLMFLWLFVTLSVCSFVAIIVTSLVTPTERAKRKESSLELVEC